MFLDNIFRLHAYCIAIAFAATILAGSCACSPASKSTEDIQSEQVAALQDVSDFPDSHPEEQIETAEDDGAVIDPGLLASLMGEDEAAKLIEEASVDNDRHWIAAHPDAIDFEGEAVQAKLLTLAADEDDAVSFVREFADKYPAENAIEPSESTGEESSVPHLYQWDSRWGYTIYSSTAFGLTGCGPTAFAMAYQGVTGKKDLSPYDMGVLAQEMGHMAQFEGTSSAFLVDASVRVGIECEPLPVEAGALEEALRNGKILIANVGHGYFSHYDGHYLVLTGLDSNGLLALNDPYSAVRSNQSWDVDFILGQTKGLYAFSA